MSRIAFETTCRAGAVALVTDYRTASGANIAQVYRARPAQLKTPSAYIESVAESTDAFTVLEAQRTVRVGIRLVWGVYDSGPTVDARDKFVDGFYGHVMDNPDALGANTTCSWVSVADDETWTPDWLDKPDQALQSMYSTLITLEGFAST
jgi:hypothetical protein